MIVCAAVKFLITKTNRECILCGIRHGDCFSQIADLGLKKGVDYKILCEGFMDAQHNFYTREDAFNLTLANGQLSASTRQLKRERNEKELYSEDLY